MAKGITEIIKDFKILHPKAYEKIYEQGRADAINEAIDLYDEMRGSLATNVYEFGEKLKQLKEQSNDRAD